MLSWNVYSGYRRFPPLGICPCASRRKFEMGCNRSHHGGHQLLKGKQLYSARFGVYMEVLQDVTAVLKGSAAKGETQLQHHRLSTNSVTKEDRGNARTTQKKNEKAYGIHLRK